MEQTRINLLVTILTGSLCFGCFDLKKSSFLDAGVDAGPENGDLSWVVQIGGAGDDAAMGLDLYAGGDIALVGRAGEGAVDFAPGETVDQDTVQTNGCHDIFLARLSPSGDLRWVRSAGGDYCDSAFDVAVTQDGSAELTGYFNFYAVFDQDEANQVDVGSPDAGPVPGAFAARYAPNGDLEWAVAPQNVQYGASHNGTSVAVSSGSEDRSFITGSFTGDIAFGAGEEAETNLLGEPGSKKMFVAAMENNGTLAWAKQSTGSNAIGQGVGIMTDGSVVVTGSFEGQTVFGQGEAVETTLTAVGGTDAFVARYAEDGALIWARGAGGLSGDSGVALSKCGDDAMLVAGVFSSSVKFGPDEVNETTLTSKGKQDVFVAKYEQADGKLVWARSLGGTGLDGINSMTVMSNGSFLLVGSFQNAASFGQMNGSELTCESAGGCDAFTALFDAEGNPVWVRCEGGTGDDAAWGVAAPSDNSAVVAGVFSKTVIFGKGEQGRTELTADVVDAFVMRLVW